MKVLIVGHSYLAEENQKQLTKLANYAEIEVASPRDFKGMIFNYNITNNIISGSGWKIRLFDKWIPFKFPEAAYFFKSLSIGMQNFKPDIIHIEGDPFTTFFIQVFLYAKIYRSKAIIICTVKQNTYTHRNKVIDNIKDFIARFFSKRVDHFLTVNSGVAQIYRERFNVNPKRMTSCTHLGVDVDTFSPDYSNKKQDYIDKFSLSRGDQLVGYCGRLVEYKGVSDLIDAVSMLRDDGIDCNLALLGDGPMRKSLETLSLKYSWLYILDPIPHREVVDFYRAIDIFVMPSRVLPWHIEHDAHALLEAMSVEVPCIATRCGALEDVLPWNELLVDPENVYDLKNRIQWLINNKIFKSQLLKEERRIVVDKFSIEAVSSIISKVYTKNLT